jgi:AAA domain
MTRQEDATASLPPAPQGDGPRHRFKTLGEFLDAPVQRRAWAVQGVWPAGASGLIAGAPKAGKSTLCMELAVSLATGTPFMGHRDFAARQEPARVAYVQAENSEERVRKDLDAILCARGLGHMEDALPPDVSRDAWQEHHRASLGYADAVESPPPPQQFVEDWPAVLEGGEWRPREPDLRILSNPSMNLNLETVDMAWLAEQAGDLDYMFLDPLYLLTDANVNDTGDVSALLNGLGDLRRAGCAVIITHQMTDKSRSGSEASRLLGSTFFHAWYEAALFTQRTTGGAFTVNCDNLREMGREDRVLAHGNGVGSWTVVPSEAEATDEIGRPAPRRAGAAAKALELRDLELAEPGITGEAAAERLGVSPATVFRYRASLRQMDEGSG